MRLPLLFLSMATFMLAIVHLSITNLQAGEADHPDPIVVSTTEEEDHLFREKCYTCHGNDAAYKEWKHSGHSKALINLRHDDEEHLQSVCLNCHSSGYALFARIATEEYNIDTAINAVACSSCHLHNSAREHLLVKSPQKLCVSCHKIDCGCAGVEEVIHQSQSEMFLGREGIGVRRKPSPHVKAMKKRCVRCHMAKEDPEAIARHGGHTFIADFSVCSDCHDNMNTKLKQYREEIEAKLQAVEAMLDSTADASSDAYKAAKWNHDLVKGDNGYGLHNIPYARALLDYSLSLKPQLVGTPVD